MIFCYNLHLQWKEDCVSSVHCAARNVSRGSVFCCCFIIRNLWYMRKNHVTDIILFWVAMPSTFNTVNKNGESKYFVTVYLHFSTFADRTQPVSTTIVICGNCEKCFLVDPKLAQSYSKCSTPSIPSIESGKSKHVSIQCSGFCRTCRMHGNISWSTVYIIDWHP